MATAEANGTANDPIYDRIVGNLLKERQELEVDKIFRALVKLQGSDLHMKVGNPPIVRVHGDLKPLNRPPIENEEMVRLLVPMMDEPRATHFEEEGGADFAYVVEVDGVKWRFRVNMLKQLGKIGLVARRVNNYIPKFEGLYLPPSMETLCHFDQGMVLLAGVTGSVRVRRSVRCSTTSTRSTANTSSPWKTRSSSCIPKINA